MLFIGRTIIRKHNWAERRMDGGRAGVIQRLAHITRGISRSSQNRFSLNVRG